MPGPVGGCEDPPVGGITPEDAGRDGLPEGLKWLSGRYQADAEAKDAATKNSEERIPMTK